MTSMVKVWDPRESYWELHPMLQNMRPFKAFYTKDKSKGKKESSKIMWAVAMYVDPNKDNAYKNMDADTKRELISEDHLNDAKFNWEHPEIVELCDGYTEHCLTILEKEMIDFEEKLVQRGKFLKKVNYTMDTYDDRGKIEKGTADQLDKMMLNTGKLVAELENINEKLSKAELDGELKGGATESAAESGLL